LPFLYLLGVSVGASGLVVPVHPGWPPCGHVHDLLCYVEHGL
jgi:hypothetical protein